MEGHDPFCCAAGRWLQISPMFLFARAVTIVSKRLPLHMPNQRPVFYLDCKCNCPFFLFKMNEPIVGKSYWPRAKTLVFDVDVSFCHWPHHATVSIHPSARYQHPFSRNNFQPSFCRKLEETSSKDLNGQDPLHSRLNKLENTDVRGSWTHFAQANLAAEPHAHTPFHEEWHLHSPLHRLPPVYRPHTQPKNKTHVWVGVVYSMFVIV